MKVEIEPQFAKNLLAYLAEKPIKEAMGAYNALALEIQHYEHRLASVDRMAVPVDDISPEKEDAA